MLNTFKYTVLSLFRNGGILVWALAFPIVLSTCFVFMFSGLDDMGNIGSYPTIVVTDGAYDESEAFQAFIEAIGGADAADTVEGDSGDGNSDGDSTPLLAVTYADSAEEAHDMLVASEGAENPYIGYITLPSADDPEVHVSAAASMAQLDNVGESILVSLMDSFTSRSEMVRNLIDSDPVALTDPAVVTSLFDVPDITHKVEVTANAPKESVRYYFALLGMAALFGAQVALVAVLGLLPNMGPLGARRAVSGVSHASALAATMLASWLVSVCCLAVAYAYIRLVCGVDFGGRDAACLLVIVVSSLMATSLGAALAAIPKLPISAKGGLLTAIVCFAALFSGLYGQPTMELADSVAAAFPASQFVNPAVQISQAFFSLMYYDTLAPCFEHLGILLVMCAVLFVLSAHSLRRQRYASL